jgi:hypothetical protein
VITEAHIALDNHDVLVLKVSLKNNSKKNIVAFKVNMSFVDVAGEVVDAIGISRMPNDIEGFSEQSIIAPQTTFHGQWDWLPSDQSYKALTKINNQKATLVVRSVEVVYAD